MSMAAPAEQPSPWVIVELSEGAQQGFQPYGGGLKLWKCKSPEVVISGPAETGKTRTALEKFDTLMWKYPRSQAIIIRKTFKSLKTSVLLTFEHKVLGAWNNEGTTLIRDDAGRVILTLKGAFDQRKTPVVKVGGEHVEGYIYPNGSRIYLGGMDTPEKVLSSEWDVVYVNQAEELTLNDWEIISTRTTGRAGNMPYAQMLADCNPSFPTHWIRARAATGRLKFIESRHEDNPTLYNQVTHQITEQGKRSTESKAGTRGEFAVRVCLKGEFVRVARLRRVADSETNVAEIGPGGVGMFVVGMIGRVGFKRLPRAGEISLHIGGLSYAIHRGGSVGVFGGIAEEILEFDACLGVIPLEEPRVRQPEACLDGFGPWLGCLEKALRLLGGEIVPTLPEESVGEVQALGNAPDVRRRRGA